MVLLALVLFRNFFRLKAWHFRMNFLLLRWKKATVMSYLGYRWMEPRHDRDEVSDGNIGNGNDEVFSYVAVLCNH
jgi:hypothetical protein